MNTIINTFRDIFELTVEGKRVLMFQVPAAPRGIPMGWQGHFYARRGESLVALDMSKYEEIRREKVDEDWSRQIVKGATIADLDPAAIKKAPTRTIFPVNAYPNTTAIHSLHKRWPISR